MNIAIVTALHLAGAQWKSDIAVFYLSSNKTTATAGNVWRAHCGQIAWSGSALESSPKTVVPGPATLVLLMLPTACSSFRRGRTA